MADPAPHVNEHRTQQHRRLRMPSTIPIPSRLHSYHVPFLTPSSAAGALPFPSTPSAVTPSKRLRPSFAATRSAASFSSVLLLLFSLRSLYSLLPFIRSAPSYFSLFPFSFLVALVSLLFLFLLSVKDLAFVPISPSSPLFRPLISKSFLLALVLLLRFHALRYCAAGAVILADLSGSLLAKSLSDRPHHGRRRILGFAALAVAVSLLSYRWDRIGCFPLSSGGPPDEGCARVSPMLLPFVAGFLGFYERAIASSSSLRELGRRRVRLFSLAFATAMLFVPASISFLFAGGDANDGAVSLGDLGWPLLNTVIFGVLLSESYNEDKLVFSSKDFRRDFAVTFFCTLLLELFYFPKLSLPGFILCGFLLWIAVIDLGSSSYVEIGSNDGSDSLNSLIIRPIRHILSERKSRKIALFLLINATYMVVEFVAGFMSNSLGLISDACHMLFDCAALAIGLYASYISRLPANSQFNYGRGRFEVLSGYANAVFLVLVGAMIVLESFERILDPQEISTNSLFAVSIGGLIVNVIGLVFFHEEHHHAHGSISTCSHSHSHAHEEHHHHHHKHESKNVVQVQDKDVHHSIAVAHGSNQGLFHGDSHNVGHCPDNDNSNSVHEHQSHKHDNCSHDHADHHCHGHESKHIDSHEHHAHEHGKEVNHHHVHEHGKEVNHHHGHEHADHNDSHEHDHNDHVHGNQVHVSQDFSQLKHEHKNAEVSKSSHSLCSEDHIHNHGNKKPSELSHATQHACTHSHSTELSVQEKPMHALSHHHIDHNMQGIFLHVLADTLGSIGVVISTLLIKYKGWTVADPICSIFISVMIISSVIPLLKNSAEILLQRVPRAHEQDLKFAVDNIKKMKEFCGIQSMHVWNLTNTEIVGTLHVHVSTGTDKSSAARRASNILKEAGVGDLTIHVECVRDQ